MVPLKSCPFCGGRANYSRIPSTGFSVLCSRCGAIGVYGNSQSKDDLGHAWNRRTVRTNLSIQSNIAPCPFCASRLSLEKFTQDGSIFKCARCGMIVSFATANDAYTTLALWNRRAGENK